MSDNLVIKSIACKKEKQQAIELIHQTFFKNSQLLEDTWKDLDFRFRSEQIFGAFLGDEIQGCCILSPVDYIRDTRKITVSFLTYVCVHGSNQHSGIGSKLIKYAIEMMRVLKYDSIITIARKSADHYYTKFGFFGASVYPLIEIKGTYNNTKSSIKIIETKFNNERIQEYETMRKSSFSKIGYFARNERSWMTIEKKISSQRMQVFEFHDKKILGYAISFNNIIIEIALAEIKWADQIINSLLLRNNFELKMQINHLHPILYNFHLYDLSYQMRNCPYGGHMVLPRLKKKEESREQDILKNFENKGLFYVPYLDEI